MKISWGNSQQGIPIHLILFPVSRTVMSTLEDDQNRNRYSLNGLSIGRPQKVEGRPELWSSETSVCSRSPPEGSCSYLEGWVVTCPMIGKSMEWTAVDLYSCHDLYLLGDLGSSLTEAVVVATFKQYIYSNNMPLRPQSLSKFQSL